jgi:hypothetical protein
MTGVQKASERQDLQSSAASPWIVRLVAIRQLSDHPPSPFAFSTACELFLNYLFAMTGVRKASEQQDL